MRSSKLRHRNRLDPSDLFEAQALHSDLPVLYEDNHLLVVNKPAGLATMGVAAGERSAVTLAAAYLKKKYAKPGNVFVGVVSRLDSLVSGVLIFARTSKAAARLSEQIREHEPTKRYLAWVEGKIDGRVPIDLEHWMLKDESHQRMICVDKSRPGAQRAQLTLESLEVRGHRSLVGIRLITGRKHQIRVQLSAIGHPVLGDRKYNAHATFPRGIALHCEQVTVEHPTRREPMCFDAPVPDYWPAT